MNFRIHRLLSAGALSFGLAFSIVGSAAADNHDAPPSPEEIRAMDAKIRVLMSKLPTHLKARANQVQDLHMKFKAGMAQDSPDTGKNGDVFFTNAIVFMKELAADPKAKDDPAVHELIHFIANDFGEGDVPKGVPTLDLIKGEIDHLIEERKDFQQNPPKP